MFPTFDEGEIIVARVTDHIAVGDIVVFRHHELEKIKRVSKVEAQRLYVLGDNPTRSTDSRHFGRIDRTDVLGVVIWPR